jgi:hypothetical protein
VPLILHDDVGALQYNGDGYETDDTTTGSTDSNPASDARGMQADMVQPVEGEPVFVDVHPMAGSVVGIGVPSFAQCRSLLVDRQLSLTYPFGSEEEMELGGWLHESGLSHAAINNFFQLPYVRRI